MIKKLKHSDIDFKKYSFCIENSGQKKYSAEKEFLDVVCQKNWEVLVYGDYEAVMPIPYTKKFGKKIVVHPFLCQQLGVFSKEDSKDLNDKFLQFLLKNYDVLYYAFNDANHTSKKLLQRKNYLIFPENYELVRKRYSPKRKRKLRIDEENIPKIRIEKQVAFADAKKYIEKNLLGIEKENDLKKFFQILNDFSEENALKFYGFYFEKQLVNLIALHCSENTVALLGTFNEKDFIKLSGASILIDEAIKDHIENKIFDFEGSDLANVEEFFRGFRPVLKEYAVIKNSKKEFVKNSIKRKLKMK